MAFPTIHNTVQSINETAHLASHRAARYALRVGGNHRATVDILKHFGAKFNQDETMVKIESAVESWRWLHANA